jgi:hypothetical protein
VFQENIQKCAEEYVQTELNIMERDSVVVNKVDTITEMGYAKLVLEMLENLEYQYKLMYDEATLNNDEQKLQYLEIYLNQISSQVDYFRNIEESDAADNQQLLLYLIYGSFYIDGEKEDFICLANPDFTLHVLDPFADNLLIN